MSKGTKEGATMKRAWLGVAVLLLLANVSAAATPERWLHVSVESGKDGEVVHVNVPLSLAEKILPTINHGDLHNGRIKLHEAELNCVDLRAILDAVRTAPDNEFVTVQSKDQNVRVAKQDGKLVIHVLDRGNKGQKVDVQIPMPVVEALTASGTQDLDIVAALHALGEAGDTLLVSVQDEADHVRIWVDAKSGSE
jgi:hypothetical protein